MTVRSAGLIGKWQDEPAHPRMNEAARRLGHGLASHRGQQVTRDMLDWADTVLAMDQAVLGVLRTLRGDEDSTKFRLCLGSVDVPDLMGKDSDAFNDCAVLIEGGTALHLGNGPG
ncbi:low molecular weight phosphotyrosine protein phosphatase [Streptomyces albidoflavus]